jgi:hypothetical protein
VNRSYLTHPISRCGLRLRALSQGRVCVTTASGRRERGHQVTYRFPALIAALAPPWGRLWLTGARLVAWAGTDVTNLEHEPVGPRERRSAIGAGPWPT